MLFMSFKTTLVAVSLAAAALAGCAPPASGPQPGAAARQAVASTGAAARDIATATGAIANSTYEGVSQTASTAVFVKQVVRRFHAASLISGALISVSGLSQSGPAGCQLRVFPDKRCGFCARAFA